MNLLNPNLLLFLTVILHIELLTFLMGRNPQLAFLALNFINLLFLLCRLQVLDYYESFPRDLSLLVIYSEIL